MEIDACAASCDATHRQNARPRPRAREKSKRARRPLGHGRSPRRGGLAPRRRPCQRERKRERERDASTTLTRPNRGTSGAHSLTAAYFFAEDTRHHLPLKGFDPVPLQGPVKTVGRRPRRPTQTRPYVRPASTGDAMTSHTYTLCSSRCQPPLKNWSTAGHNRPARSGPARPWGGVCAALEKRVWRC